VEGSRTAAERADDENEGDEEGKVNGGDDEKEESTHRLDVVVELKRGLADRFLTRHCALLR
jgi:hypothetical protein